MAAGDLITRDGQYEFQGILFNNGPWTKPTRFVTEVRNLWGHTKKTNDQERDADDGAFLGDDFVASKLIEFHVDIECTGAAQANQEIIILDQAWQPMTAEIPFVFQKAGLTGKKVIYVRPRDIDIPSNYDLGRGFIRMSSRLFAPDPRIYSLAQKTASGSIAAGSTNNAITATNDGTFLHGSRPIVEIDGPTVNPRVTFAESGGEALRLDGSLAAGQTIIIDTYYRTVTIGGVDAYSWVRTDNQWPKLMPGVNNITYSRTGTTGTSPFRVKFQDAWI